MSETRVSFNLVVFNSLKITVMIVLPDLHRSKGRWECGHRMLLETHWTDAEDEMSLQTEGLIHICQLEGERSVRDKINLEF